MAAGIRVTVAFPSPVGCPVADLSASADAVVDAVSTSVAVGETTPTTEFLVDADAVPTDYDRDPVFAYADRHCYRVDHDGDCPCAFLGERETPVDRYFASGGSLELVFHAGDFETLQAVVGELRERFEDVDIRRMVRESEEATGRDTVFVDRGKLTDRQLEVLRTAHGMGYFERPREANASEVAATLDISPATLREHLQAAQSKVFADVLEAGK